MLRSLVRRFGWTRHSAYLFSAFLLVVGLIIYIWWPLAVEVTRYIDWSGPWWRYMDWLLIGIFLFMTLAIMAHADLRSDALVVFVGIWGGLAIESWGTQTNLWFYFTAERPPLWIIPAWPIASLTIDRLVRWLDGGTARLFRRPGSDAALQTLYWLAFGGFYLLMLRFVAPTFDRSYTWLSLLLCALVILSPGDRRMALLNFVAGAGLGYFLELWGTTRECWTYYTFQKPPLFAVLAHGMAAVVFWRTGSLLKTVWARLRRTGSKIRGVTT